AGAHNLTLSLSFEAKSAEFFMVNGENALTVTPSSSPALLIGCLKVTGGFLITNGSKPERTANSE
ncbi:MAG: hypothetical protein ACLFVE_15480, partial [Chitinispirillaceae bacterium]